ncbi:EMILIN-2-like [Anguilla anguilla]|uniref:EMILIN-2-like n=1 Tax=Anguilla anguilla TaxID=7936 RepID=UPI0015A9320E|nr:EMILIN-2-like [Anguilla anguilla]
MKRYQIDSIVRCSVLSLLLTGLLIQATPQSYDLFQGSAYAGGQRHRNKNWCARVVYKNVTCSVLGSAESYLEPDLAPCPPHEPDCAQRMTYRTQFRPTYRIAYKTVTQLEWRCCPGFQGPDCAEPKATTTGQTWHRPRPHPQPQPIPGQVHHRLRPSVRETAPLEWGQGGDRMQRLEGEMDRLSQTVRDLQAAITGMNENLRLDLQEDTSRTLLTLLNTLHLPVSDLTAGPTESVQLVSHAHPPQGHAHPPQGHAPSSDSHAHPSQGHAPSQGHTPLSNDRASSSGGHASSSQGPAPSSVDPLHSYIESRFQDLRAELVGSMEAKMEAKMAALAESCDVGLRSLREECEQQGVGFQSLAQQLDRKEAGLRDEIRELRLHLEPADGAVRTLRGADDVADLRREVGRLADAHRALNARVDNELAHVSALSIEEVFGPRLEELEGRMNVTEHNAETLCFYVDEKLSRRIANETDVLRTLLEERLGASEDQFTTMLVEIASGNGSFPAEGGEEALREARSHGRQIQGLEEKLNALGRQCSAGCGAGGPGGSDDVLREVRLLGGELDTVRADINGDGEKLRELESLVQRQLLIGQHNSRNLADQQAGLLALRGDVGALRGSLDSLGESLTKQAEELQHLNCTCGQAGGACPPGEREAPPTNGSQVEELRVRLDRLSQEVRAELARRRADATAPGGGNAGVVGGDGDVSDSLHRVAETLNRHAASVWARVQQLQAAQRTQAQDLRTLATSLHHLQARVSGAARTNPGSAAASPDQPVVHGVKEPSVPAVETRPAPPAAPRPGSPVIPHIRIPLIIPHRTPPASHVPLPAPHHPSRPMQPSTPQRPVVETGEAGPPGTAPRLAVRRVSYTPEERSEPMQGYAGAPGYPPLSSASLRPDIIPVAFVPRKQGDRPLVMPVSAGGSVVSEPFSFSAGLTTVPLPWHMGVIRFDKVLVNDGGHYSPRTGIFTVPQDGRYLVSAVLQGERVEGALSVSDRSVQRLTSGGYAREPRPREPRPCPCGGSASVSLILQLHRGDRVAVVRTAGSLAVSEPKEVLSTFSALFLYSAPGSR